MIGAGENSIFTRGALVQILTTILVSMTSLMGSFSMVWPSYTLKILQSDQSPIGYKISDYDGGLIGSTVLLGAMAAPVIIPFSSEYWGRKKTIMLCALSFVLGWSIIAAAKTVVQILMGRLAVGVGLGMQFIICVVFISETSQSSMVGALCTVPSFFYSFGILASYLLGWLCSYYVVIYLMLTVSVALLILFCLIEETPSYLLRKRTEREALSSLKFYRGVTTATQEVMTELRYLRSIQISSTGTGQHDEENQKLNYHKETPGDIPGQTVWQMFRSSKSSQRALLNLAILMMGCVSMGLAAVTTYAGQLFATAAPGLPTDICSVILAIVLTFGSGFSVIIIGMMPRRVAMISTCILAGVFMTALAAQLRWSFGPEWMAPVLVILFAFFVSCGTLSVPFVQLGECFPPEVKSFATSVALFCLVTVCFLQLFIMPLSIQYLGLDGTFFVFAVVCFLQAIVSYFIMRETRNVPVETVQCMFDKGFLYTKHGL